MTTKVIQTEAFKIKFNFKNKVFFGNLFSIEQFNKTNSTFYQRYKYNVRNENNENVYAALKALNDFDIFVIDGAIGSPSFICFNMINSENHSSEIFEQELFSVLRFLKIVILGLNKRTEFDNIEVEPIKLVSDRFIVYPESIS